MYWDVSVIYWDVEMTAVERLTAISFVLKKTAHWSVVSTIKNFHHKKVSTHSVLHITARRTLKYLQVTCSFTEWENIETNLKLINSQLTRQPDSVCGDKNWHAFITENNQDSSKSFVTKQG